MRRYLPMLLFQQSLDARDVALDKYVNSLMDPFNAPNVPGAKVRGPGGGKPLFKNAYGMTSLELDVPMPTNHAFAIESESKQIKAIDQWQLAAAGKQKLIGDIEKSLPESYAKRK